MFVFQLDFKTEPIMYYLEFIDISKTGPERIKKGKYNESYFKTLLYTWDNSNRTHLISYNKETLPIITNLFYTFAYFRFIDQPKAL